MSDYFLRMFAYHNWANRRALDSIAGLDGNDAQPRRYFAHILGAQKLWLLRIQGSNLTGAEVWPDLSFEECLALGAEMELKWKEYLETMDGEELNRSVAYTNSKGDGFVNTVEEIITHMFNHGTYHRGQIASKVREMGGTPASTDFIVFMRE
jgi:uncharacterized damage-inducible protein DinB